MKKVPKKTWRGYRLKKSFKLEQMRQNSVKLMKESMTSSNRETSCRNHVWSLGFRPKLFKITHYKSFAGIFPFRRNIAASIMWLKPFWTLLQFLQKLLQRSLRAAIKALLRGQCRLPCPNREQTLQMRRMLQARQNKIYSIYSHIESAH